MAMFDIGGIYIITQIDGGQEIESWNCEVLDFDENNGLLKISQHGKVKLINVKSPNFIGASFQKDA